MLSCILLSLFFLVPISAVAAPATPSSSSSSSSASGVTNCTPAKNGQSSTCAGLKPTCGTAESSGCNYACPVENGQPVCDQAAESSCNQQGCDLISKYLNPLINLLSVIFGLVAVISIILGGIQYSASEGDPQKASQAKSRITKTVFAIVSYFFLYAFLQFIVPGGVFNKGG